MVSNNSRHNDKIIGVDQYETLTNIDPIPLTTSRLKQVSNAMDRAPIGGDDEEVEGGDINDYDDLPSDINNDSIINILDMV
jgi:hypothetical protein